MSPDRASVWRDAAVVAAVVSALVGGATSVIVARQQSAAAHEQAAGVFVGIAMQVLTSKDSTNKETMAWARRIVDYYSPVPLTDSVRLPKETSAKLTTLGASGPVEWVGPHECTPDGPAAIVTTSGAVVACHPGIARIAAKSGTATASADVTVSPDTSLHVRPGSVRILP